MKKAWCLSVFVRTNQLHLHCNQVIFLCVCTFSRCEHIVLVTTFRPVERWCVFFNFSIDAYQTIWGANKTAEHMLIKLTKEWFFSLCLFISLSTFMYTYSPIVVACWWNWIQFFFHVHPSRQKLHIQVVFEAATFDSTTRNDIGQMSKSNIGFCWLLVHSIRQIEAAWKKKVPSLQKISHSIECTPSKQCKCSCSNEKKNRHRRFTWFVVVYASTSTAFGW